MKKQNNETNYDSFINDENSSYHFHLILRDLKVVIKNAFFNPVFKKTLLWEKTSIRHLEMRQPIHELIDVFFEITRKHQFKIPVEHVSLLKNVHTKSESDCFLLGRNDIYQKSEYYKATDIMARNIRKALSKISKK